MGLDKKVYEAEQNAVLRQMSVIAPNTMHQHQGINNTAVITEQSYVVPTPPKTSTIHEQNNVVPVLPMEPQTQQIIPTGNVQDIFASIEKSNKNYRIAKERVKIENEQLLMARILEQRNTLSLAIPLHFNCAPTQPIFNFTLHHPKLVELSSFLASSSHDDVGVLLLCLGAINAATCGRVDIEIEHSWVEKTSNMQLHACDSGTKKSSVIDRLRKPFEDFQSKLECAMIDDTTRDAYNAVKSATDKKNIRELTQFLKGKEFTPEVLDKLKNIAKTHALATKEIHNTLNKIKPILLVDKTTPSGLAKILHAQGESCACISAEGDFVESMLLKSICEPSFFNKLFNQEAFTGTIDRKNIHLKHPSFSMLCFIQHSILSKFYGNEKLQNLGTTARVLPYLHSGRKFFSTNYAPNSNVDSWYYTKIINMLNLYHSQERNTPRYKVKLTPDAVNIISEYKQELDSALSIHAKEIPARSKLCGQAVRFAWAIHAYSHAIPHDHHITANEVVLAIELCRILQHHITYIYAPSGFQAYDNAKKIITNLQNININIGNDELSQGYIDSRALQQRTHIKAKDMLDALRLLESHHWVNIIDNGKRNYMVIPHPRIMYF